MKPGIHVDQVLKNASDAVLQNASQIDSYKRNLHRVRAKKNPIERFPKPESLEKWVIPEKLRYFLLYDSLETLGAHRFIMFSTPTDLLRLAKCDELVSDGNYDMPLGIYQVSYSTHTANILFCTIFP